MIRIKLSKYFPDFFLGAAVFTMFFTSYFFCKVHIDNYIYFKLTDFDLNSIFNYCLYYGNGRILGNILCAILSHKFYFVPFFISITLTSIVFLLNRLIFKSNRKTVLLIFLLILIKDISLEDDIYSKFPVFVNYVCPILLMLISLCFLQAKKKNGLVNFLTLSVGCLSAFSSSLFSENTSIIFLLFSVSLVINDWFILKGKHKRYIYLLFSLIAGSVVLWYIPYGAGVSDKLDWYREVSEFNVKNIFLSAAHKATFIADFLPIFLLATAAVISYLLLISNKPVDPIHFLILTAAPFFIVLIKLTANEENTFVRLFLLAFLCIYFFDFVVVIIKYFKKDHLFISLVIVFLSLTAFAIMTVVSPSWRRLFYVAYFFICGWSLWLFKIVFSRAKEKFKLSFPSKHIISALLIVCLFFTGIVFLNNTDDFNKHIYQIVDTETQNTIDLENDSIYFYKFVFALNNRKYAHPRYCDSLFYDSINWNIF